MSFFCRYTITRGPNSGTVCNKLCKTSPYGCTEGHALKVINALRASAHDKELALREMRQAFAPQQGQFSLSDFSNADNHYSNIVNPLQQQPVVPQPVVPVAHMFAKPVAPLIEEMDDDDESEDPPIDFNKALGVVRNVFANNETFDSFLALTPSEQWASLPRFHRELVTHGNIDHRIDASTVADMITFVVNERLKVPQIANR